MAQLSLVALHLSGGAAAAPLGAAGAYTDASVREIVIYKTCNGSVHIGSPLATFRSLGRWKSRPLWSLTSVCVRVGCVRV